MKLRAWLCLGVLAAWTGSSIAATDETTKQQALPKQQLSSKEAVRHRSDDSLTVDMRAYKYAPVLRFASTERYYPTVPFFSVFDGFDNDGDDKWDLADPDEIAPFDANHSTWEWRRLFGWYNNLNGREKHKIAAGFYRVRDCDPVRVKEILRSDGARYYRLHQETRDFLNGHVPLTVYEYYFYYIEDAGITGHAEDIEMFYTFVAPRGNFLILVGAAHESGDANNVAVVEWLPNEDAPLIKAFVELGGHAMAPDVLPHGQLFRQGSDVNWHFLDAWGVRDVVATVGAGALEPYQTWKTDTRSEEYELGPIHPIYASAGCDTCGYSLIPAETFFGPTGVHRVVDWCGDGLECVKVHLRETLDALPANSFVRRVSVSDLNEDGVAHMATWTQDGFARTPDMKQRPRALERPNAGERSLRQDTMAVCESVKRPPLKHIVTEHPNYVAASPTTMLKPYLFRSKILYPIVQRSSSAEGDPTLYVGIGNEAFPFHRIHHWLNVRGALHVMAAYEVYDEGWFLDLTYILSPARLLSSYFSYGTDFPDQRFSAGLLVRMNPRFICSHVFGAEARVGVSWWHQSDLSFGDPTLQFSLAFPWDMRRY